MAPTRVLLLAGCLFAFLLAGCGKSSSDSAQVRVLNLIHGLTNVSVTVGGTGGTPVLTGGNFETIGEFASTGAGNVEFKTTVPGNTGTLIDTIYSIGGATNYTYVISGNSGASFGVLIADPYGSPGSNVAVRVLNMSPTETSIDLYLTAPGTDIGTATPVITAATLGTVTSFFNVNGGDLEMRLTAAGTKTVLYDANVTMPPGSGQTIVAYGRDSNSLLNVAVMASNTTGAIANSTLAQLKVTNGTAVPAPLNVLVDGTVVFPNLPFANDAEYQVVAAGTRTVTVESAANPGATLLTVTPNLVPATDNSIALAGPAGAMTALVLADSNPPVPVGQAQLRVVNVSPELDGVDVYANSGKIVSALGANAASAYVLVDAVLAGTTYRFDVNPAGTTTVLLSIPGETLASGHAYTLYLLGSGATLSGVLSADR
jgi:Domain of unknown function (DUF4397)